MKDFKKQSKLGKQNLKAEVRSPKTLKAFSSKISDMSLLNKITLTAHNTIIKKVCSEYYQLNYNEVSRKSTHRCASLT